MNKPTLVIMAAGMGSRYGGLKQIDPVGPNGEIIIDYSIYDAVKAGFGKIVFIIRKDTEQIFKEKIGNKIEKFIDVTYVFQDVKDVPDGVEIPADRIKPWGTAHAILSCKNEVTTPFAVINADDFYGASSFKLLADFLTGANDENGIYRYCMVGFIVENTLTENGHVARGICTVDDNGNLVEIHERTRIEKFGNETKYSEDGVNWVLIPKGSIVSMNTWGFTRSFFKEIEDGFPTFFEENKNNLGKAEYFLPEVVGKLVKEKKAAVKVLPTDEHWYGVTYIEDKLVVKKAVGEMIDRGVYPNILWEDSI
jgi:hypothetical protein